MKRRPNMMIDYELRTRELLQESRVPLPELADLAGVHPRIVERLARSSEESVVRIDASCISRLHDWLILTELASDAPLPAPTEALVALGNAALCIQRQARRSDGLLIKNERAHVLVRAAARLNAMSKKRK